MEEGRENNAGRKMWCILKKKSTVSGLQRMHVCLWTWNKESSGKNHCIVFIVEKKLNPPCDISDILWVWGKFGLGFLDTSISFLSLELIVLFQLIKNRLIPHHNMSIHSKEVFWRLSCLHFIHLQSAEQHLDWQTSQALSWYRWLHAVNLIWRRTLRSVHSDRPASCLSPFPPGLTCWMLPATWTEFNTLLS